MNTVTTYTITNLLLKLDKYVEGCNTLNDLSNKVCLPNKTRFKYKCF